MREPYQSAWDFHFTNDMVSQSATHKQALPCHGESLFILFWFVFYEMLLLNRLECYAEQKGLFSDMQLGFKKGVGRIEALFTVLETMNHMLELAIGSKVFGCFLDVREAFDTVWIDCLKVWN